MSNKNNHQPILEKAAQLASLGMFTPAITRYFRVLKSHPDNHEIWLQLAHCLGLSGQREEAILIHNKLKNEIKSPSLFVRIARDLEEWSDYEGSLATWNSVLNNAETNSKHANEAIFHKARILERMNHVEDARKEFEASKELHDASWFWRWLEGRLAERLGDYSTAKKQYEKAMERSPAGLKAKSASAIARLSDKSGNYEEAYHWLEKTISLRSNESGKFQTNFPLAQPKLPEIATGVNNRSESAPIFLTGYPRAGTTLLARQLTEHFHLNLSEEHNYIKQLVDECASYPKGLSFERITKKKFDSQIAAYWKAQQSTIADFNKNAPILDKNPSLSPLIPWLLCLFPRMKTIWQERDIRDLWLSSAMLDSPMNGATCWWQSFQDYEKWHHNFQQIKDYYSKVLPPEQFIEVHYDDLVTNSGATLLQIKTATGLTDRQSEHKLSEIITSPSYVEAVKPINTSRVNRWSNYLPYLPEKLKLRFESM